MLSHELQALKSRCQMAANSGYIVGKAETYVATLQAIVGPALPPGCPPNSAQHILALISMVEKGEKAPAPVKAAPKPAPVKEAPKPAPVKEPEPPPVELEPLAAEPEEVAAVIAVGETVLAVEDAEPVVETPAAGGKKGKKGNK